MVAHPTLTRNHKTDWAIFYAIGDGKKPHFRTKKGYFRGKTKKIAFFAKKICKNACQFKNNAYLCNRNRKQPDSVAQLVEQMTLNHWVESSSLSGVTKQSLKSGCFFYFCRPQAVAYLQHASARTGLWKSVVAPRRWTYRCGTVLSMSIKWRGQPPKGGCIIIAPGWLAYLGPVEG